MHVTDKERYLVPRQPKKAVRPSWLLRIVTPLVIVVAWLAVAGIGGPYFGRLEEVVSNDPVSFLPESAESTEISKRLSEFRTDTTLPALAVFESSEPLTQTQIDAINTTTKTLSGTKGIETVPDVIISEDKKAALVIAPIDANAETSEAVAHIRETITPLESNNLTHNVTGPAGYVSDLRVAFAGIDGVLLLVALSVVLVILVIVYRSPLLPIIVLSTSMIALAASIILVFYLAQAELITLNGQVQGILFILVIGAATDYSLLYVSRYREELYATADRLTATLRTIKGSIEPILASGGTVIIGLLCLLLSDLGSNKALGPVGAIGIATAMLAALTILPSALLLTGRRAFWPLMPHADAASQKRHKQKLARGIWHKVGVLISGYPRRVWVISTLVLAVLAVNVITLKADGVAQSDIIIGTSDARDGQAVLEKHFSGGSGNPVYVTTTPALQDAVVATLEKHPIIDTVTVIASGEAGFRPLGIQEASIKQTIRQEIEAQYATEQKKIDAQVAQIAATAGPAAAQQARERIEQNIPPIDSLVESIYPFKDAAPVVVDNTIMLQATLTKDAYSNQASNAIPDIREQVTAVDATAKVGGTTAAKYDTNTASVRDSQVIIPTVLVAITIVLMLLLRAVVAPLVLLATTVLSFGTALGVSAFMFNTVWGFPGGDPSLVLFGFIFLVALGIDYNIFLMTRVREETVRIGTKKGVIKGLVVTGSVITSAGIVLAATFAALAVLPILFLAQLAFVVAFGVLLDTIIVRSLLVPALIHQLGRHAWWPSKQKD